jgi:hypothetical protein
MRAIDINGASVIGAPAMTTPVDLLGHAGQAATLLFRNVLRNWQDTAHTLLLARL